MNANSKIKQGMLKRVPGLEECTRSRKHWLKNRKRTRHTNLILFTHSNGVNKHYLKKKNLREISFKEGYKKKNYLRRKGLQVRTVKGK